MAELSPPSTRSPTPPSSPGRASRLAITILALSLFGCDHATKVAAEAGLGRGGAIDLVSGVLELRYVQNDDTAFSLLRSVGVARTPGLLLAAAAIAVVTVAVAWVSQRKRASRAQHVGFALVLAGALGNIADRAMRGYVVDFIHVTRWPVFNVADIAVVAGVLLLVVSAWRRSPPPSPAAAPPA